MLKKLSGEIEQGGVERPFLLLPEKNPKEISRECSETLPIQAQRQVHFQPTASQRQRK